VGDSAVTGAGGVHGFPAALTSFIGRDGPLREVAGLLEEHRLVTVTGPGGAGKTRLAGRVARTVAGRFADGAWLAELAPVRNLAQVPSAVLAALGMREQPGMRPQDALAQVLARQQLLLVLDNCEHVIGAAAELCAGLLAACDDVRVLATSREPLAVAGEARYRLGPLTLPGPGDLAGRGSSEAVALFADRARSADPRFALDDQTAPAVARLVARLDGMPLAIELAAARVEALGVAQLLDRLDDRFELLTGGNRLAVPRQRSLAATVEWSYRLLDESARRVFRAVSVFPGPFTLQAAEAVAGPGIGPAVLHLVDCSLLVPPRAGVDGRARYSMLETLRGYGTRILAEAGEAEGAAIALTGHALRVAEEAGAMLQTSAGEAAAARWLDAEDATMGLALARAMDHDVASALRLTAALAPWWLLRGRLPAQYRLLREVAGRATAGSDGWAIAQFWLGYAAVHSADLAAAVGHFTAVCNAAGDRPPSRVLADCLSRRSRTLAELGQTAEAGDDGRRSLALSRDLDYAAGEVVALLNLAVAALYADNDSDALQLIRQAGHIQADIPGWIYRARSNVSTFVLIEAGELVSAGPVCSAGVARSRDAGDLWNLGSLLAYQAKLDLQAQRVTDAGAHLNEALHVVSRTGGHSDLLEVLDGCGHLCTATGRSAEALTVWASFASLHQHERITGAPAGARRRQESMRQAQLTLGPARARAAGERGAAMSRAAAAEYALMLTSSSPPPAVREQLSARERELVTLVARGRTDAQIAAELYISIRTVRSHLDRIRDKTGCRRRADLTRLALAAGLI
jgi:predicted ATPase/DNA-binding CsgD family transcriptional regulator